MTLLPLLPSPSTPSPSVPSPSPPRSAYLGTLIAPSGIFNSLILSTDRYAYM